jgi:hypothetical protein
MAGGMGDLGKKVKKETDEALQDEELKLLVETTVDWESLRPQIADQATYDTFIDAVKAATAQNESVAQFKTRITALGSEGLAVARKVLTLIP